MTDFNQITIIGVGLIGGSFARACKSKGLVKRIVGFGRSEKNLKKAVGLDVIDSYSLELKSAVSQADLIFISTPVMTMVNIVKGLLPYIKKDTIITDGGSVKGALVVEIDRLIEGKNCSFVGGHPIAGKEKTGVEASFDGLFKGAKCIITPTKNTNQEALSKVKDLWENLGSRTMIMAPELHDIILASVSHLPHIIAYSLVNTVGEAINERSEIKSFAAGGFSDITRVASSDPVMWRDICSLNKKNILECIETFQNKLSQIKDYLEKDNLDRLLKQFETARNIRGGIYESSNNR